MRESKDPDQDSAARLSPSAIWHVSEVQVLPGHRLRVGFRDGTRGEVDVSRLVFAPDAGVFEALRDPEQFAQVRIEQGAVTWPGELDLAPDAMYDAIRADGMWTPV